MTGEVPFYVYPNDHIAECEAIKHAQTVDLTAKIYFSRLRCYR